MRGSRWLPVLVLGASLSVLAHDLITTKLTYSRDVRPILDQRCLSCHGASSNIPLTTYQEVRPWAVDIKEQVLSRSMPPWGAVKGFRALDPDQSLTEDELTVIAAWVVGGAPEGTPQTTASATRHKQSLPAPVLPHATPLQVETSATLPAMTCLVGIQPLSTSHVDSAKITAHLPDGRTEPLLWLMQYDGASQRSFYFHERLLLPAGTVVSSTVPLRFALQTLRVSLPAR